ncbi:uncharacterized protein LOC132270260 [Cornus florida]|uniref:uncharacterized protein LOC132270260 n=1 Tax=Cornus florida TaxID=4283 RepID=UPI00289AB529|nr:uncharacterized protein LOC132270260 [Cornus florida]
MTQQLRPLYVKVWVEGQPINRVLVDNGSVVNVIPATTLKKLGKTMDDVVPTDVAISGFNGGSSNTKGILPLEITIGGKTSFTAFFIIDSTAAYNLLLGRDWIHPNMMGQPAAATMKKNLINADIKELLSEAARPKIDIFRSTIKDIEDLYEEVSANTADIIEEGFEKLDAIQLEDLESAPSRMEDNKAELQDPLLEINVEMPGLSRKLVEHRLPIKKDFQPYKQPPRRMSSEVMLKIQEEIERLLKAVFIRTVRYVEWLSNVVPVMKKNGKLRVCVDFHNLKNATPKDEYPMPVADQLIDSAAKHEILSFMDGHSGYNQIYLAEEDVHKTAFRCPGSIGTFEWIVMPFGLKNAGATYQRAMNSIFHDMIGRFMEIYIDDVVVKSSAKRQHLEHLKRAFERMRIHKLKMNPLKCAFGVSAGNFLGFLVHKRGIEVDQNKVKAIINARAPANKKQVQRFLGQVGFLRRFISNHAGRVHVFSTLVKLKTHEKFHWDESHQKAFDKIKEYLANPPVVMPPRKKWPLKLYLSAAEESIGSMLAQDNEHGKEQAVYYLSRVLTDVECRYSSIEKLCLSLYYSAMKLRVYMRPVDVYILCQTNVIKYMLSRPLITGRIGKWALALMEFNFIYVLQKSVKGRVLADFLADHPSTDIDPWVYDELESSAIFLTPWILMFDGSSTADGAGAGIVIISPAGRKALFSFFLDFKCSNNQAEYEALIIGLEILIEMAFWPRGQNKGANSMAQAASGIRVPAGIEDQLIKIARRSLPSAELRNTMLFDTWTIDVKDLADDDWRIPFIMFLRNPKIKADRSIKRKAINFVLLDGDLNRKGLEDGLLLQCISKEESLQVMAEVHEGSCGAHQAGIKMRWLIRRGWGLDLIGKINPPSSEGHHWVIVATDYFTKWVEAKVCKAVNQQTVINFMEQNIIHRFGIPETLVSDNATLIPNQPLVVNQDRLVIDQPNQPTTVDKVQVTDIIKQEYGNGLRGIGRPIYKKPKSATSGTRTSTVSAKKGANDEVIGVDNDLFVASSNVIGQAPKGKVGEGNQHKVAERTPSAIPNVKALIQHGCCPEWKHINRGSNRPHYQNSWPRVVSNPQPEPSLAERILLTRHPQPNFKKRKQGRKLKRVKWRRNSWKKINRPINAKF